MSKTRRQTTIEFRKAVAGKPYLYELGIPVVEIEGTHDINVCQKIPLSHDRTTVSLAFLKEVYAELLNALQGTADVEKLGAGIVKVALESDRITPETAKGVFHKMFGANAVIQSAFSPDANQEAARANCPIVSGRTFGAEVNDKLRLGGVKTSEEVYGRHAVNPDSSLTRDVKLVPTEQKHEKFLAYARMLANELFKDDPTFSPDDFVLEVGQIERHVHGVNYNRTRIIFNLSASIDFNKPVSACTHLILHELAHCRGSGHDGVYDHETERLVNKSIVLLAKYPEKFRQFEPSLFLVAV